jgi:hypothetical protein
METATRPVDNHVKGDATRLLTRGRKYCMMIIIIIVVIIIPCST